MICHDSWLACSNHVWNSSSNTSFLEPQLSFFSSAMLSTESDTSRSPPRFAELQSEWQAARSSNWAVPETTSSRRPLRWETAPSGSFHKDFLRDPRCFIRVCDALTWLADDILLSFFFWLWWCFSFKEPGAVALRLPGIGGNRQKRWRVKAKAAVATSTFGRRTVSWQRASKRDSGQSWSCCCWLLACYRPKSSS